MAHQAQQKSQFSHWMAAICLCLATGVQAAESQDPAALQRKAEQFLKMQATGLPGKLAIEVKPPRSELRCHSRQPMALASPAILSNSSRESSFFPSLALTGSLSQQWREWLLQR